MNHLIVMVTATVLFAATWIAQLGGYRDDEVRGLALVLGLVAFAALAVGGNVGGANVFVYGIRVLKREDVPVAKALSPLGVGPAQAPGNPTRAEDVGPAGAGAAEREAAVAMICPMIADNVESSRPPRQAPER